jgi:hypothetical protein
MTAQSLGITAALYRNLRTTNPIENLNGLVAHYCRNVKRRGDGQIVLRRVASALSDAATHMRKLRGCRQMRTSLKVLGAHRAEADNCAALEAALHLQAGAVTGYRSVTTRAGATPANHVEDTWCDRLTYLLGLSDGSMIDGAYGGNATRHLNHACEPFVEAVEDVDASNELVTIATRHIAVGERLFLDQALDVDGDDPAAYPRACGSTRCRGTLVSTCS